MEIQILFMLVFASQIWLLSYHLPKKMMLRLTYVHSHYPISQYPKLYPNGDTCIPRAVNRLKLWSRSTLMLGLFALVGYFVLSFNQPDIASKIKILPLLFGFIQFIPFMLLEIGEFKQFKLMRNLNKTPNRSAQMQPRRISDFVSFGLLMFCFIALALYILVEFFLPDFSFKSDKDSLVRLFTLLACNVIFVFVVIFNLTGKKLNPLQDPADRMSQIKFTLKTLISTSIALSIFNIVTILINRYQADAYEIIVYSIYFQAIALLGLGALFKSIKVEELNFDVYKNETEVKL